jgi:DNA-binding SARP family transcriptional activator/membrane-associated phospholipid phosphatase
MLRLQLLGGFRAQVAGGEASALAKVPRRAALLTYLALERDVARTRVIALLWPDVPADRGRHSLNQAIYYLRGLIGADWVELRGDHYVVAPWVTTDVEELERAAAAGAYEDVLRLYQGPLLAGTTLADTIDFDTWVEGRRAVVDRLHRRARRQHLAALTAAGRTQDALQCAEAWCRLDPLEDEAQHRYMELLASVGQRGAALQQFTAYQRLLDEYQLKPLDETTTLIEQLQHGEVGSLPAAVIETAPLPEQWRSAEPHRALPRPLPAGTAREPGWKHRLLHSRAGLSALLAAVFVANWMETSIETWLAPRLPAIDALRLQLARASHWLEGHLSFEHHELTNRLAVIGYSTAYFLIFPLLVIGTGVALARRPGIRPYRVFATGVAITYLISLPFFLFFPVPERWFYADSGAIVLSDLWSVYLIDFFRPFSGLDNSFPSVHVSLTVLLVLASFVFRLRFRWMMLFLGATTVLATVALGIHWITDVLAGAAVGVLSVMLALRLDRRLAGADTVLPPPPLPAPARGEADLPHELVPR